jgi:hypothetical protein
MIKSFISSLSSLESNYPGAKAGEGEIFTFPQASARYVKILGTTLGGVGTEFGYRIELGEVDC